ncbi:hypothetical protein [Lysobacter claricitrinus]
MSRRIAPAAVQTLAPRAADVCTRNGLGTTTRTTTTSWRMRLRVIPD